jgi:hypothetical protein
MWLGSADEAPSNNNDGGCVIEPATDDTVGAASGRLPGPSSHSENAELPLHDVGGSPTAPVSMDGVEYACPLDQNNMELGGPGNAAGSVTLARYLDSDIAPGTSEVAVFVCAPDTERTTNGEPLPYSYNCLAACRVCGLGLCFVLVCSS